MYCLAKVKI